jgi:hypothetical protein
MSNEPKQNPHHAVRGPQKSPGSRREDRSSPDSMAARRTKVPDPTASKSPDSTETYNSSKTANPLMPWSEPEIDEVSPYGPGHGFVSDDQ